VLGLHTYVNENFSTWTRNIGPCRFQNRKKYYSKKDLNLKQESVVGCIDRSGLDVEALAVDVGGGHGQARDVDAQVVDASEAATTVAIYVKN
jgi:hypothetical protein